MIDSFSSLFGKLSKLESIRTDDVLFRLFYKLASFIHFCFMIILGLKQYFGDPITCDNYSNEVKNDHFNNYCWIHGTYTIEEYLRPYYPPEEIPHQGKK